MSTNQMTDLAGGNGSGKQNDEAALAELKAALEEKPDDPELTRRYAKALTRARRFDDALDCWHKIEELLPEDPVPATKIAKLIIARSRYRALHGIPPFKVKEKKVEKAVPSEVADDGFRTPGFYRSNKRKGPQKRREVELTEIQKLERAVQENPANVKLYYELSDFYIDAGRDYDAERLLQKGAKFLEDDLELCTRWEDIRLLRSRKKLEVAEKRASVESTPGAEEALANAQEAHQKLVLEIFNKRVDREPENTAIRYEFGLQLKRAGFFRAAYVHFKQALEDPQNKASAHLECGECLQRTEKYPEAMQCYRQAIAMADEVDQPDCKKLALYRAGVLSGGIKLRDQAKKFLTELIQIDPGYRDAEARLIELG